MSIMKEANKILVEADKALRGLMEDALKQQRYMDVAGVAPLADGVARLLSDGPQVRHESPSDSKPASSAPASLRTRSARKVTSPVKKRDYPRFERDGDRLVKLGWSKKQKSQYEHRAPRVAVFAFATHLASRFTVGETFAMENLLPVADESGEEVPSYQAYLTLAWLKYVGAVEKKGRDGYVVRDGSLNDGGLDKIWSELDVKTA